ncbi:hypothetical protein GC176_10515 [bacterium]|nr:hypothetical protein [bacterium]
MFRCQKCGQIAPPGAKSERVAVSTRSKVYPSRGQSPERRFGGGFRGRPPVPKKQQDRGGEGREIVQELMVCPNCAEAVRKEQAAREAILIAQEAEERARQKAALAASLAAERESSDDEDGDED